MSKEKKNRTAAEYFFWEVFNQNYDALSKVIKDPSFDSDRAKGMMEFIFARHFFTLGALLVHSFTVLQMDKNHTETELEEKAKRAEKFLMGILPIMLETTEAQKHILAYSVLERALNESLRESGQDQETIDNAQRLFSELLERLRKNGQDKGTGEA